LAGIFASFPGCRKAKDIRFARDYPASLRNFPSHSGHLSDDRLKSGRFPVGIVAGFARNGGRFPSEYWPESLGIRSYEGAVRQYEDSRKTIGDIYSMGAKAFRPPSNLGFLSFGLEILIPNIAETQIEGISSQGTLESDNKLSPTEFYSYIHGPFDITFLVTMGLSFLAIIFSYASISGEKENGTLKLILSNSVFRSQKMEKIADPIPEKLERKVESSASVATASSSNRELYA
jgi:hypothetical protein